MRLPRLVSSPLKRLLLKEGSPPEVRCAPFNLHAPPRLGLEPAKRDRTGMKGASAHCRFHLGNGRSEPRAVYSAMHGVGAASFGQAKEKFGLRARTTARFVEAQERPDQRPDPAFPTAAFPKPEEGEGALTLAIEEADACGATSGRRGALDGWGRRTRALAALHGKGSWERRFKRYGA
jgi:hypothetical protein